MKTAPSTLTASVALEVPFHDVDAMNVCWHGNYLKYFEVGRAALLRAFDYDYPEMQASGYLWPIVEVHLKFVLPATYGQRLEVRTELLEYQNRLKIGYTIVDAQSARRLTRGYTIQVAVEAASKELQFISPDVVYQKLERVWQG